MNMSNTKYSFPIWNKLTKEYLQDNFWKCFYNSNDPKYHYWLVIPKNVKPVSIDLISINELNIYMIGQYVRIDDSPYLEVNVGVEHLDFEINCSDWLKKKLFMMNEEILQEKEFHGKSTGTYLDVLTRKIMNNGETVISRYTTIKDSDTLSTGANYFLMKVCTYEKNYEELSDKIFHIVTNWNLINKTTWQLGEPLKPFTYKSSEKISFYIPSSWEVFIDNQDSTKTKQKFLFKQKNEKINISVINSYFYSEDNLNLEKVFEKSFSRLMNLEGLKYQLEKLSKIGKILNPNIYKLWYTQGNIIFDENKSKANLMIYIIQTEKGWYYFESIGSEPNLENYNWEINKRCLELIVQSFNNLNFETKEDISTIEKRKEKKSYYKTVNGKNYTEEEWRKFEQEQWEKYSTKYNLSHSENKNSFLAD